MPAHWCIFKLMFYIYLIQYLFNISEYKAMLIKLLIYHINIDVVCIYVCIYIYVCVYIYMCVYIYIYIYIYIIYICVCVYVCMCVYIYIYIYVYMYVCVCARVYI